MARYDHATPLRMRSHRKDLPPEWNMHVSITIPCGDASSLISHGELKRRGAEQACQRAPPKQVFLFFLSAAGCTIGWKSILSNLVYYTHVLGHNSYLCLNMAVYSPLLPITLAQARWYAHSQQQRHHTRSSYFLQGTVSFSFIMGCVSMIPWASHSLAFLSLLGLVIGCAFATLHGILKQMASIRYPLCGRLPAAVNAGMQASAAFVLIVSLLTDFGSSGDPHGIMTFYASIAILVGICWIAFQQLMMDQKAAPFKNFQEPTIHKDITPLASELTYHELWIKTRICCISVMVTVSASMTVASWFDRVQSTDPNNHSLPQVLFYSRLFADLFGRPATLVVKPSSTYWLAKFSICRLLFVVLFFLYIATDTVLLPRNDAFIIFGVSCFAFSSGYIVTACYQRAPGLLSVEQQGSCAKQTGLINVCFSAAVMIGLTTSSVLRSIVEFGKF